MESSEEQSILMKKLNELFKKSSRLEKLNDQLKSQLNELQDRVYIKNQ